MTEYSIAVIGFVGFATAGDRLRQIEIDRDLRWTPLTGQGRGSVKVGSCCP
jgi:hypothetical protein